MLRFPEVAFAVIAIRITGDCMSKTNCINCGAAKDTSEIKCPFCGTTYLDLTAIDFSDGKPVVCQFVLPDNISLVKNGVRGRAVMSMLAVPTLEQMTMSPNTVSVYGGFGNVPLASFTPSWDVNIGVSFKPVARQCNKELFSISVEEN